MTTTESFDYETAAALSRAAHDAFDTIERISSLPDPACDISIMIRALLIDRDADDFDAEHDADAMPHIDAIRSALAAIDARNAYPAAETSRHMLSMLLLDHSLCPMHELDYAICFDDDDAECATIRTYFPSHDT